MATGIVKRHSKGTDPEPHLVNAARTLERLLSAQDPDHVYAVRVRPRPEPPGKGGAP